MKKQRVAQRSGRPPEDGSKIYSFSIVLFLFILRRECNACANVVPSKLRLNAGRDPTPPPKIWHAKATTKRKRKPENTTVVVAPSTPSELVVDSLVPTPSPAFPRPLLLPRPACAVLTIQARYHGNAQRYRDTLCTGSSTHV